MLERSQRGSCDITVWQAWFLSCLHRAIESADATVKWAKMTKSSHDMALRDIKDLIERDALIQEEGGGRSTSYALVSED